MCSAALYRTERVGWGGRSGDHEAGSARRMEGSHCRLCCVNIFTLLLLCCVLYLFFINLRFPHLPGGPAGLENATSFLIERSSVRAAISFGLPLCLRVLHLQHFRKLSWRAGAASKTVLLTVAKSCAA